MVPVPFWILLSDEVLLYRNRTVAFVSTFACFLSRAFDQLRMGVISQTNLNVVGSHAGQFLPYDNDASLNEPDRCCSVSDPTRLFPDSDPPLKRIPHPDPDPTSHVFPDPLLDLGQNLLSNFFTWSNSILF